MNMFKFRVHQNHNVWQHQESNVQPKIKQQKVNIQQPLCTFFCKSVCIENIVLSTFPDLSSKQYILPLAISEKPNSNNIYCIFTLHSGAISRIIQSQQLLTNNLFKIFCLGQQISVMTNNLIIFLSYVLIL